MWKRAGTIGSDGCQVKDRFGSLFVMMQSPSDLVKPRPKRLGRHDRLALSYWLRLHAGGLQMGISRGEKTGPTTRRQYSGWPDGVKMENHTKRNM